MAVVRRRDVIKAAGLAAPLAGLQAMAGDVRPPKKYLILSCDGGGMRGLLTARILQRLQAEVPFLDRVDLFAGTSTGGIIALGLAHGKTPEELVGLYRKHGREIFNIEAGPPPMSGLPGELLAKVGVLVKALFRSLIGFGIDDVFKPMYQSAGLQRLLKDLFGDADFRSLRPGKSAMVTTLRLCSDDADRSWAPLVLHNVDVAGRSQTPGAKLQDGRTLDTRLVDAALCTSAAPLYFPPHKHPTFGYCIDGGMFANCPASIAFSLALRATNGNLDAIRVLSIGSGTQTNAVDIPKSDPFNEPGLYGALAWLAPVARGEATGNGTMLTPAVPLVSALFDATAASHTYICNQALQEKYRRVQVKLRTPVNLDSTGEVALQSLIDAADDIPAEEWNETIDWIRREFA